MEGGRGALYASDDGGAEVGDVRKVEVDFYATEVAHANGPAGIERGILGAGDTNAYFEMELGAFWALAQL